MGRARILMRRVHEADGPVADTVLREAEAAVRELLALVDGRAGNDVRLAARVAEGHAMLAELATHSGDPEAGAELFARAAAEFVEAGLPWFAVEYEARLAGLAHQLGDMVEAERALRAALEHGGPFLEAVGRSQLHLQLAEVVGGRGQADEAAEHALEAAHWADEAGAGPTFGAWARHQLGGFLVRLGRWAEAAEVLESALADLTAETHGDGAVVQTQWWLGDCLSELGEHRDAAERGSRPPRSPGTGPSSTTTRPSPTWPPSRSARPACTPRRTRPTRARASCGAASATSTDWSAPARPRVAGVAHGGRAGHGT